MRRAVCVADAARTRSARSSALTSLSKTVEVGKGRLSGVDVHGAVLDAASRSWDRLAWIEQAERIEGRLDGVKGVHLGRGELDAHLVDLLAADPVLAGDGSAHGHA